MQPSKHLLTCQAAIRDSKKDHVYLGNNPILKGPYISFPKF